MIGPAPEVILAVAPPLKTQLFLWLGTAGLIKFSSIAAIVILTP
jgi:hypothetical protein